MERTRLTCTSCGFEEVVEPDSDPMPHEVLVAHGRQTGHTVSIDAA